MGYCTEAFGKLLEQGLKDYYKSNSSSAEDGGGRYVSDSNIGILRALRAAGVFFFIMSKIETAQNHIGNIERERIDALRALGMRIDPPATVQEAIANDLLGFFICQSQQLNSHIFQDNGLFATVHSMTDFRLQNGCTLTLNLSAEKFICI